MNKIFHHFRVLSRILSWSICGILVIPAHMATDEWLYIVLLNGLANMASITVPFPSPQNLRPCAYHLNVNGNKTIKFNPFTSVLRCYLILWSSKCLLFKNCYCLTLLFVKSS